MCTVKGVQMCTRKFLLSIKGISEAKVDKIKEAAMKMADAGFITAMEYSARREKVIRITTGSAELDKLLGGMLPRHPEADTTHVTLTCERDRPQVASRRRPLPKSLASFARARHRSATHCVCRPSCPSAWAVPTARYAAHLRSGRVCAVAHAHPQAALVSGGLY